MTPRVARLALAALLLTPGLAAPAVTLRTGNFYLSHTDLVFPGGFEPKIERTYNSKTPFKGIFGSGWGSELDVYLVVEADGTVTVHEYGGGAEVSFTDPAEGTLELETAIEDLSRAARKRGLSGAALDAYRARLRRGASFRRDEWAARVRKGELRFRDVPIGLRLALSRSSRQWLLRVPQGWLRAMENGRLQRFDPRGRLERISDANGHYVELRYGANGKPEAVVDDLGRSIRLEYDARGLVRRAVADDGRGKVSHAAYRYDARDRLVASVDYGGNRYTYEYDERFNLRRIGYSDGTDLSIAYFSRSRNESVRLVKERDGSVTRYAYDVDPSSRERYAVAADAYGPDGGIQSRKALEYFVRRAANGEEWTWKVVETLDGNRKESRYDERCGHPLEVVENGERAAFEYDVRCRVVRKETPSEVVELAYGPAGKVSQVVRTPRTAAAVRADFEYDERGKLVRASSSDGRRLELSYDRHMRIARIGVEQRVIRFEYDHECTIVSADAGPPPAPGIPPPAP
jgi:YD repeat-containing protein